MEWAPCLNYATRIFVAALLPPVCRAIHHSGCRTGHAEGGVPLFASAQNARNGAMRLARVARHTLPRFAFCNTGMRSSLVNVPPPRLDRPDIFANQRHQVYKRDILRCVIIFRYNY